FAPDILARSPQDLNLYAFSVNNPLRFRDPDGLVKYDPNDPWDRQVCRNAWCADGGQDGDKGEGSDSGTIGGQRVVLPEAPVIYGRVESSGEPSSSGTAQSGSGKGPATVSNGRTPEQQGTTGTAAKGGWLDLLVIDIMINEPRLWNFLQGVTDRNAW